MKTEKRQNILERYIKDGYPRKAFNYLSNTLKRMITDAESAELIQQCKTKTDILYVLEKLPLSFKKSFRSALERFKTLGELTHGLEMAKKLSRNLTPQELDDFVIHGLGRHHPTWESSIKALEIGATDRALEFAISVSLKTCEKLHLEKFISLSMDSNLSSHVSEELIKYFLSKGRLVLAKHFAKKNNRSLTESEVNAVLKYAMQTSNLELAQKAIDENISHDALKRYVKWLSSKFQKPDP